MQVAVLPDATERPEWPAIANLLLPALTHGGPLLLGNDVVWIAHEGGTIYGAATSGIIDGEAELRLAAGTRHREWIGLLDEAVSAWARDCGATRLAMRGRWGWRRYARRFGWDALGHEGGQMLFEKEL